MRSLRLGRRHAVRWLLGGAPVLGGLLAPLDLRAWSSPRPATAVRALFIGNSYTRFNDLPGTVQSLAASVHGGPPLSAHAIANPGWDLPRHWRSERTRGALEAGGFTHVVLQGHSLTALEHPHEFAGYAGFFHDIIRRHGALTVLFETWARRRDSRLYARGALAVSPHHMQSLITDCYAALARDLQAELAPAGRAFLLAEQAGDLGANLYRSDGAHPSREGTLLAALVLCAILTRVDPRRTTFVPEGVAPATAARLRQIARASLDPAG